MKTEVITLTPEIAAEFLSKNPSNRPISLVTVEKYASSIKRGEWSLNGQPIIIFSNGNLGDGQHRCHAVIKAGLSIPQLLVTDVQSDSFATIDTGKSRNGSDSLHLSGYKNCKVLTTGVRAYMMDILVGREKYNITNTQIVAYAKNHPHIEYWTNEFVAKDKGRKFIPGIIVGLLALSSEKHGIDKLSIFYNDVVNGVGLNSDDPAFVLRERLLSHQTPTSKLSESTKRAFCIKAINAYIEGRKMKLIKFAEGIEEMPKII